MLPKSGLVISEKGNLNEIPCKPKIIPLKSVTLEKIEQMEARVQDLLKQQLEEQRAATQQFGRQD